VGLAVGAALARPLDAFFVFLALLCFLLLIALAKWSDFVWHKNFRKKLDEFERTQSPDDHLPSFRH
jgi:hypothetical protein